MVDSSKLRQYPDHVPLFSSCYVVLHLHKVLDELNVTFMQEFHQFHLEIGVIESSDVHFFFIVSPLV